jgi:hypothetical protein
MEEEYLTSVNECSSSQSWGTPMAGTKDHMGSSIEYYQRRQQKGKQIDLNGQVMLDKQRDEHCTQADPANDNTSGKNRESSAENWSTPNTMDHLDPRPEEGVVKQATGARKGRTKPANLREQVDEKTCQIYKEAKKNWQTPNVEDAARKGSKEAWKEYEDENRTTQCRLRNQIHNDNWATPQASDHIEGARTAPTSNQKCLGRDMNRTWPTSRASAAEGGRITTEETNEGFRSKREKSGQYFGAKLRDAVETHEENWPTPNASTGGGNVGKNKRGNQAGNPLKTATKATGGAKLNPNWVEQLMLGKDGVGWTQLPTEWID